MGTTYNRIIQNAHQMELNHQVEYKKPNNEHLKAQIVQANETSIDITARIDTKVNSYSSSNSEIFYSCFLPFGTINLIALCILLISIVLHPSSYSPSKVHGMFASAVIKTFLVLKSESIGDL